tara:strand:+ start:9122 stop:10090 length:969 start_codon:yes stop_codon:yes gene_type:complete
MDLSDSVANVCGREFSPASFVQYLEENEGTFTLKAGQELTVRQVSSTAIGKLDSSKAFEELRYLFARFSAVGPRPITVNPKTLDEYTITVNALLGEATFSSPEKDVIFSYGRKRDISLTQTEFIRSLSGVDAYTLEPGQKLILRPILDKPVATLSIERLLNYALRRGLVKNQKAIQCENSLKASLRYHPEVKQLILSSEEAMRLSLVSAPKEIDKTLIDFVVELKRPNGVKLRPRQKLRVTWDPKAKKCKGIKDLDTFLKRVRQIGKIKKSKFNLLLESCPAEGEEKQTAPLFQQNVFMKKGLLEYYALNAQTWKLQADAKA